MFGYQKQTYYDKAQSKEQPLRNRLEKFSKAEGLESRYLNPNRVVSYAKETGFSWKFYRNLRSVEHALHNGVRPPDPYPYVEAGAPKAVRKQEARRMLMQGAEAGPAQKAAELKQSRSFRGEALCEPVAKEEQKGEKQADRQAAQVGERIGQLSSFFKNLSRSATIAHGEEDWGYQPKKQKTRKRLHDRCQGLNP